MVSLREYATSRNISYEAVRKQVDKYKEELGEHLSSHNNKRFLDEQAVEFLDNHRGDSGVTTVLKGSELISPDLELKKENDALVRKLAVLQDQLLNYKDKELDLAEQNEQIKLLTATRDSYVTKNEELAEEVGKLKATNENLGNEKTELEQAKEDLEKEIAELEQAKAALVEENKTLEKEKNSYVKSFFGFYRKKSV